MSPFRRSTHAVAAMALFALAAACSGNNDAPAAGASSSAAAPAPPDASDDADPRPKVVCLGDSLTAGLGLVESQAYPALLQQRIDAAGLEFEVINAGVSGDTTAGGLRRLEWVLKGNVQVVVVALGGNDALRGLSVADMKQNLAAIIEQARARGAVVVLAGMQAPPNYGPEYATAFRQTFMDLAREQRVSYIPFLLDRVAGNSDLNQGDGIHPNARGAEIIAETVWSALRPILHNLSTS